MAGRPQGVETDWNLGNSVVEALELHARVAGICVTGTVLELVSSECELHPRE